MIPKVRKPKMVALSVVMCLYLSLACIEVLSSFLCFKWSSSSPQNFRIMDGGTWFSKKCLSVTSVLSSSRFVFGSLSVVFPSTFVKNNARPESSKASWELLWGSEKFEVVLCLVLLKCIIAIVNKQKDLPSEKNQYYIAYWTSHFYIFLPIKNFSFFYSRPCKASKYHER